RHVAAEEVRRLIGSRFELALAFGLGRTPPDRLRERRALDALVAEECWAALFLDVWVERGQLVIDDRVDRFLAVVLRCRTTQAPELLGVAERLGARRVVAVLHADPRGRSPHAWHAADHGLDGA